LLGIFFDPEDVGEIFIRNVADLTDYTALLSQKRGLLIITAVKTSNPKFL
jgi:hypothetical protein